MNKKVFLSLGIISLLLFGFGQVVLAQAPVLKITSPEENQQIKQDYVVFSFSVENFELYDYHLNPPIKPGQGHLIICLDEAEPSLDKENCRPHIFIDDEIFTDLTKGKHFITAQLVGNDHQPIEPEVKQTVNFKVTAEEPLAEAGKTDQDSIRSKVGQQILFYKILLTAIGVLSIGLIAVYIFWIRKLDSKKK